MLDEINIVWFKRDLRITDHLPIYNASNQSIPFIPLYILNQNYWSQGFSSIRHWNFVYDCLEELNDELTKIGQPLIIKNGSAVEVFKNIQSIFKIKKVYTHEETSNDWVRKENLSVKNWFDENQIELIESPTNGVIRGLKSRDDWIKIKNQRLLSDIIPTPLRLKKINNFKSDLISRKSINFKDDLIFNIQKGGRKTVLKILDTFLNLRSKSYLKNISSPKHSSEFCSRISPYLTWGAISSKEVIKKVKHAKDLITKEDTYWKKNLTSFQSRLSWRCHFIQKLEDDPTIENLCMHKSFENLRVNSCKEQFFNAWKLGQTGYPFVDACMRNLINQGWITFRMRAMLVSFASYDLWLDWRDFAHHLAKLFTDYEPGIHYSQLQMQSGVTGINTYRIYNPVKQSKEHDENGDFIKKWVPELQNLNSNWVHEPWKMDFETQKKFRCIIGKDYPHPVVDHKEAVSLAKSKIAEIRKEVNFKTIAKKVYTKHGSRNSNRDNNFVDSKLKKIKTNKQLSLSF